ncbi:MAG: hydroxymethylglutaryl-CoA lyase [Candidatus Marinimicrobia bacterium]|nr:hydroxymethylglutaryl-CoA lyase [Candidatus Neomarinimicrobiota bacterium]MBT3839776.1 hydroxymethylglutaryl-CoA lyase [Candidatus Neomarinimicrobiota bacterium]MBT3999541.1 hydroxymethylglutaryl-CoA lyase [Candidatus Neomarinimicrobiota bacterium]MBT4283404.1 hydroxymethylglutaryl-CoA lyase [Candidatus Neomarinimicrobiota bacterium]MBT4578939.1 hydroxymethylglutaryl-CoA lyase [Candidatus Neomarinimicrobiota bacterium]
MNYPNQIILTEVGPRDGLQSISEPISTDQKLSMIRGLVDAGIKQIQVASFVHPKWVPQMAAAEDICARLPKTNDVIFSGLALNNRGVERAIDAGLPRIEVSISTSETHSKKNANMTLDDAMANLKSMIQLAKTNGLDVRAGLQAVWGCVYDGIPPIERIVNMSKFILNLGVDTLSLSDSTGMGNPNTIKKILDQILPHSGDTPIVLHLHDTRGLGLANVVAALDMGINQFDSALGGIGGCPFIKGATGNIATEDTVHLFHELGIETGIDLQKVAAVSQSLVPIIGDNYFSGKLYKIK